MINLETMSYSNLILTAANVKYSKDTSDTVGSCFGRSLVPDSFSESL